MDHREEVLGEFVVTSGDAPEVLELAEEPLNEITLAIEAMAEASVRGLTTAASLWMTASLGILFGVGFYALAIAGAVATVCVLAAVRASETILPQRRYANVKVRFLRSASVSQQDFRDRVCGAGLLVTSVQQRMERDSMEFSATVSGDSEDRMGRLTSELRSDQDVMGFDYIPHDV